MTDQQHENEDGIMPNHTLNYLEEIRTLLSGIGSMIWVTLTDEQKAIYKGSIKHED